jgi:peptide deformylase
MFGRGDRMSVLDVVFFPNDVLRSKAAPIVVFDAALRGLVTNMFDTMDEYNGIGLAAPQINISKQVLVVGHKSSRFALINPKIMSASGSSWMDEGCLSLPNILVGVERAGSIVLRAKDVDGIEFEKAYSGMVATIIQHEMDHLNGVLIIDYGSPKLQIDE